MGSLIITYEYANGIEAAFQLNLLMKEIFMNRLVRVLCGIVLGISALSTYAQTTRDVLYWGTSSSNGKPYYSFSDSSCYEVETSTGYIYGGPATFVSKVYCSGFSAPVIQISSTRQWSGTYTDCFVYKSSDARLIYQGSTCGGGLLKATVQSPPLTTPRDLAYWSINPNSNLVYSFSDKSCHESITTTGDGYWTPYKYTSSIYCSGFSVPVAQLTYQKSGNTVYNCTFTPSSDPSIVYDGTPSCGGGLAKTTKPKQ